MTPSFAISPKSFRIFQTSSPLRRIFSSSAAVFRIIIRLLDQPANLLRDRFRSIHAGIHFRSSTLNSILLGEQVALSVLQDRAKSYNEPFTIRITKLDGTTASITN